MDTSEQYILMCDCEEIQLQAPEFYKVELTGYPPFSEPVTLIHQEFFAPKTEKERDVIVWLPRQDQLQEILGEGGRCRGSAPVYLRLYEFARGDWNQYSESYDSYRTEYLATHEQLWLAFVMKEKHNKVWDGEVWK